MTESITRSALLAHDGLADWRAIATGVCAHFGSPTHAAAVSLLVAVGALADAAQRTPDVDLRRAGVTVRLAAEHGFAPIDVELARAVSTAARELGLDPQPHAVQDVQLTLDVRDTASVRPFWAAVLGYAEVGDEDVVDPLGRGAPVWFQPMDDGRTGRNRLHVDVFVAEEVAAERVRAAVAAGGRVVRDRGPRWWTLADPEGNEVDVATWHGRP